MSKPKTIKETYSDALYWAMSPKSKDFNYHLTRVNESILRKLIHYDKKGSKITYSNELIARHTYLDVSQIKKGIPSLNKIGFIKTITFQVNEGGKITSRRIINIDWEFITEVLASIPKVDSTKETEELLACVANDTDIAIEAEPINNIEQESKEVSVEIIQPFQSDSTDFNINEFLTPVKVAFAKKLGYSEDELMFLNREEIDKFFFNDGIMKIKTVEKNKEDWWENIYGITLRYMGAGSILSLAINDSDYKLRESFRLSWTDFNKYLDGRSIEFGALTQDNFYTLKQYEKKALQLN
jgi:hypothetical protein